MTDNDDGNDLLALVQNISTKLENLESNIETRLGGIETRLKGIETKQGEHTKKLKGIETKQGDHTKKLENLETRLEMIGTKQDEHTRKLKNLERATPGALEILNELFVVGDDAAVRTAQRRGGSSTWTLMKASKNDVPDHEGNDDDVFFLVSSGHCVGEIFPTERGTNGAKLSLVFLCDLLGDILERQGKEEGGKKVAVRKVWVRKEICRDGAHQTLKQAEKDAVDIIYLELSGLPPQANHCTVPFIAPLSFGRNQHVSVAGRALSWRVVGSSLQYYYERDESVVSFVANFLEKGASGTVMFGYGSGEKPKALGCFKGEVNNREGYAPRGWFVQFPEWGNLKGFTVNTQIQPVQKKLVLEGLPTNLFFNRSRSHRDRQLYLVVEGNINFNFGRGSFGGEDDDEFRDFDIPPMDSERGGGGHQQCVADVNLMVML